MKGEKRFDYRHIICIVLTIVFVLLSVFIFPSSFVRLIEGFRDFGLSIAYYFCELFGIEHSIVPTINDLPKSVTFDWALSETPYTALPQDWEQFKVAWHSYWQMFISKDNILGYFAHVGKVALIGSVVVLSAIPLLTIVYLVLKKVFSKQNNDYNEDTKQLTAFKVVAKYTYHPIKQWICDFIAFMRRNKGYLIAWAVIWAYNFNLITIVVEFVAFYFYFVISFDALNIYRQVYKLCFDLWTPFHYVPWFVWVVVAIVLLDKWRKSIGYGVLNHHEMKNRGFINERPIVFMACGSMGKSKTTFITDVALSQEVMFRDKAFEKILENDLKFPYFPWINLENLIKTAMEYHHVYNLATVRALIRKKYDRWQKNPTQDRLFDYDYNRYGLTYDDNLKVVDIWSVIETYAQLYFIYVIESSLLISNYSVRVDGLLQDAGNFPLWNADFFKSDSRLIDAYSRHAHILDFDTLRLGRRMVDDNQNANNFEFGVVLITEVGKERGNSLELSEKKKNDVGANQKNDLFNSWLKMVRHSATVDNYPFVRVICDEQRPESWGADARDLCEIVYIKESGDMRLAMPFFTVAELLYSWIFSKFRNLYNEYRFNRGDNTLAMHLLKSIVAKIQAYYTHIYNRFGYKQLTMQVESGTMDGQSKEQKYYLSAKKIYSKRFSTDCFGDFFTQKAMRSPVGIDDLNEYVSEKATFDELSEQNSYFVTELLFSMCREKTDNGKHRSY